MKDASVESARFEPTVFGAVRRYRIMVVAFALAGSGGSHWVHAAQGETPTRARPVSRCPSSQGGQSVDSEVLLMESPAVAQRAASIANATLHDNIFSAHDFYTSGGSVTIVPPSGAAVGSYGASIIGVTFTASSPRVAQVGANALLQAFNQVRSATIAAQYSNAIAGIDKTINATVNPAQRAALLTQRDQQLVNEQIDLAQQPTVAWAIEPTSPVSSGLKKTAAEGLVIGLVLGAAVAYVRASRRRGFIDRQDPAALYGVPLIGEIPAFEAEKALRSNGAAARGSAGDRRPSLRCRRSVPFRRRIRRTDPRRTGSAPVARFRLAPCRRRKEHGRCQSGVGHRRRRHPCARRGRRRGRGRPDHSAPARYPGGRRPGAGAGRTATAGEMHPAQPAQRRGRRARVGSGATAAGDGRSPREGGVCAARDGKVKFRHRADRHPGLAAGGRRHRTGRRLRRRDHRPRP